MNPTTLALLLVLGLVAMVFAPLLLLRNVASSSTGRVMRWLPIFIPTVYAFLAIFNIVTGEVSWMTAMWAALCLAWVFMARKMRTLKETAAMTRAGKAPD
jgi:hypothetical protein